MVGGARWGGWWCITSLKNSFRMKIGRCSSAFVLIKTRPVSFLHHDSLDMQPDQHVGPSPPCGCPRGWIHTSTVSPNCGPCARKGPLRLWSVDGPSNSERSKHQKPNSRLAAGELINSLVAGLHFHRHKVSMQRHHKASGGELVTNSTPLNVSNFADPDRVVLKPPQRFMNQRSRDKNALCLLWVSSRSSSFGLLVPQGAR